MNAGYGRGHYGEEQLAPRESGRGGRWIKAAILIGIGTAIWFFWPRKIDHASTHAAAPPSRENERAVGGENALDQIARSRGYESTKEYEDAIVEIARDLQKSGAKIDLGPHLQHLQSRLEPVAPPS